MDARGAIARFDRGTIEIRVIDMQECPRADLAVAAAGAGAVRALVEERWVPADELRTWPVERLVPLFDEAVRRGDAAVVDDPGYLRLFGLGPRALPAREIWRHLVEHTVSRDPGYSEWRECFELYFREGCLARRILNAAGAGAPPALRDGYSRLADCLARDRLFTGPGDRVPS